MKELYKIICELEKTASLNEKVSILEKNKDNKSLTNFFFCALSPNLCYGIKKLPNPECIDNYGTDTDLFGIVDRFMFFKSTKGIKKQIDEIIPSISKETYNLLYRIFKKDPSCGVSISLVNRVWKDLIPVGAHLCKAVSYSKEAIKNIKFPAIVQTKADGARCLIVCDNGNVSVISSSGKPFNNVVDVLMDGIDISVINNYVLDGELLVTDNNGNILPRSIGNGILNKSIKNTITAEEAQNVLFLGWDMIPLDVYRGDKKDNSTYEERIMQFSNFVYATKPKHINVIKTDIVKNPNEAIAMYREARQNGEEGIILKNMNFHWQGKRLKDCVKYKQEMIVTLKVVGYSKGSENTKYADCLGAMICSTDGLYVSVGSGFSDEYRKEFIKMWNKRTEPLYVDICSNGLIKDKNSDTYSLFLPRFVEERIDKTKEDSLEYIKQQEEGCLC